MKRRIDTALGLGIFAVLMAALFGVLAWREVRFGPRGDPLTPYAVTALVTPENARATAAPLGGRVNENGRLTILEVPETAGRHEARAGALPVTDELPRASRPVPNEVLAGIRAMYLLGPEPRDRADGMILVGEAPQAVRGRLLLVDGCFRFGSVDGPAVVFPFGSTLGLIDGHLAVGPPGLAAASSARVGEVIAWPGRLIRPINEEGQAKVQSHCRSSEVLAVVPASASVAETRYESDLAERWASRQDLRFSQAIGPVRQCLERMRRTGEREPGTPCELLTPPVPPSPPPAPGPPPPPQFR